MDTKIIGFMLFFSGERKTTKKETDQNLSIRRSSHLASVLWRREVDSLTNMITLLGSPLVTCEDSLTQLFQVP